MIYSTMLVLASLAAVMEVSNEPVAIVLDYGTMENITLKAEDVLIFSYDIPQVESVENPGVTYAKRSMAEMIAANVPDPPKESQPTPPNESRFKKRLDHMPPFTGTVTGTVSIVKNGPNQRIVVVSDIQGDGVMQVLVKGNTAKSTGGVEAKPIMDAPMVLVRNTKAATEVGLEGATAMSVNETPADLKSSLEGFYPGGIPANLRVVAQKVIVK